MGEVEVDNGQYDSVTDVLWATGAALLVRRDVYLKTEDWMPDFLPTWKKLISVGGCVREGFVWCVYHKV